MRVNKIFVLLVICIAVLLGIPIISNASSDTVSFNITVTNDYTSAYEVLDIVNQERKNEGLNELQMDQDLLNAAMIRASELALNFDHTRPDGTSCFSASSKAYGENIAAGYSTPEYVMEGWMNSSGHKANILGSSYTTIGIGCIKYGSIYYWVQLFGISSNPTIVSSIPTNKQVTRSIDMLSKDVQLYYNSLSEIYRSWYPDGFQVQIVVLNPGWSGRCVVIDPSQLTFSSSDKSILNIDSKGYLKYSRAGKATITAKLKQDTSISVSKEIKINGQLSELEVKDVTDRVYTGTEVEPNITIKDGSYTLVKNKDYKLEYSNNKSCGIATIKITGIGNYTGEITKTFKIIPKKATGLKCTSRATTTLNVSWSKLTGVTGYSIYLYNNSTGKYEYYGRTTSTSKKITGLNPGTTYKVKVRGYKKVNGVEYFGKYSDYLKVATNPKKVTNLSSSSKTKNSVKLSWKNSSGATGYKIYLYNSNTKKYEYYVTTTSTSKTITGLKAGTTYKIKVRAYKKVDGVEYFGAYSDVLKVTTLKSTSTKVYITPTGKRYHLDKECGGKNSYLTSLTNAKNSGLTPCQKCAK